MIWLECLSQQSNMSRWYFEDYYWIHYENKLYSRSSALGGKLPTIYEENGGTRGMTS